MVHKSIKRQRGKALWIAFTLLTVAVVALLITPNAKRLYIFATLSHPDKIANNFMRMNEQTAVHRVAAAANAVPLPRGENTVELPEWFVSAGEQINTLDYLAHTGSTGMMILQHGAISYEQYWQGMQPNTTHLSFSVAKSFTSALLGIALQEGLIANVNDPVTRYVPSLATSGYADATLADCLQMSSGTNFDENYADENSDIFRYMQHFAMNGSTAGFIGELVSEREPGSYNKYNSMDAQVAAMVLDAALGEKTIAQYMQEKLWQPIGATHEAQWLIDGDDMELALGGLNVTLADYARFGQLFLQGGRWQTRQVVPADWVALSTTPHAPHLMPGRNNPLSNRPFGYSFLWWTPIERYGDDFFASGIYNQYIYINPSKQLVIAKTTANPHFQSDPEGYKEKYIDLFQTIARAL
ncbi:MAG: class C beta-lactamase-related serine hydrolase [Pseudomonadales bacterium]|nr:MAG: class C beta-lactamase-related serine hydrolase [Pseudomonadales bacterium]